MLDDLLLRGPQLAQRVLQAVVALAQALLILDTLGDVDQNRQRVVPPSTDSILAEQAIEHRPILPTIANVALPDRAGCFAGRP